MDTAILFTTLALEVMILCGLAWRRWQKPWLTATILEGLLQSIPLHALRSDPWSYFYAYYLFSAISISLFIMAGIESWNFLRPISFAAFLYAGLRIAAYGLLLAHLGFYANVLEGQLRFLHIASYLLFAYLIWGYNRFGIKIHPERRLPMPYEDPDKECNKPRPVKPKPESGDPPPTVPPQ